MMNSFDSETFTSLNGSQCVSGRYRGVKETYDSRVSRSRWFVTPYPKGHIYEGCPSEPLFGLWYSFNIIDRLIQRDLLEGVFSFIQWMIRKKGYWLQILGRSLVTSLTPSPRFRIQLGLYGTGRVPDSSSFQTTYLFVEGWPDSLDVCPGHVRRNEESLVFWTVAPSPGVGLYRPSLLLVV